MSQDFWNYDPIFLWWFDMSKLAEVTTPSWTANMLAAWRFACRDVMAWKGFQPKAPDDPMAYEKLMKRIRVLCQARGAESYLHLTWGLTNWWLWQSIEMGMLKLNDLNSINADVGSIWAHWMTIFGPEWWHFAQAQAIWIRVSQKRNVDFLSQAYPQKRPSISLSKWRFTAYHLFKHSTFGPRDWIVYLFGWYLLVYLGCQSWTPSSRSFSYEPFHSQGPSARDGQMEMKMFKTRCLEIA